MREACNQGEGDNEGPRKYTFFLLDKQMGSWGNFFWYPTKKALLKALEKDLVGFLFSEDGDEEEEVNAFMAAIAQIISNTPETQHFSEGMRKRIDELMTYSWHIPYIGTYENLLTSKNEWETEIRARFRGEDEDLSEAEQQAPIGKDEREAFDEFVTQPFE
jgi:hypothetical protein